MRRANGNTHRRFGSSALAVGWVMTCAGFLLGACESETTVINYRPMLGGLPGAETGTPVTALSRRGGDPTKIDQLRSEKEDGTVTLQARTIRHVMVHVYETLTKNEKDLFVQQVLSDATKREFAEHGHVAGDAFDMLKAREQELFKLFDAIPMGEYTPGMFVRPVGAGVQRLEVTGPLARELTITGIDVVMERGNYRFLWFVQPGR